MIEQIKQALSKIDGGKWYVDKNTVMTNKEDRDGFRAQICKTTPCTMAPVRLDFIANVPEWLRYLIGEVERLKAIEEHAIKRIKAETRGNHELAQQVEKLRKTLETIASIKYDNLQYCHEDAQCMNEVACEALARSET